jgi:hypothetical protein
MTNVKWWLWLHLNCGGGPCLVRYIYPGDFQQNDHCMWQKPFGQEFKWLIIMKTKQQFLTFLFIFTISKRLYLSVSSKSFRLNSALFHTFGPRSDSFFNFFGHRSNQTLFIIFSSYDRQMSLLHTDSHLQTDMTWPLTMCHVTIPVIIITASDDVLLTQTIFQAKWCPNHGSGVWLLTPLSFCCLYFAFTGNWCLHSAHVSKTGSAYILGWFPNLPTVTQSSAYSVSRDRFILVNLHHMPGYPFLSRE